MGAGRERLRLAPACEKTGITTLQSMDGELHRCHDARVTVSKNPVGRPLKFESVEVLEQRIEAYFADCDKEEDTRKWFHDAIEFDEETKKRLCTNCWASAKSRGCMLVSGHLKLPRPYTVTGLAVWLNTSRQTLLNYEEKELFFDTILAAKQRIENYAEEKLYDSGSPTRGVIFSLSNNAQGWAERKSTDVNISSDGAQELGKRIFDDAANQPQTEGDAVPAPTDEIPKEEAE